jgi:hypothetical protein
VAIIRFDGNHAIAVLEKRSEIQVLIERTRNEGLVVPMIHLQFSTDRLVSVNADSIRTVEDD